MNVLSGYLHLLEDWKERYAPEAPEDEPDERFVEACHKLEYVEYLNDLLLMSDQEERTDTVKELLTDGTIARMQTRLDEQKRRCAAMSENRKLLEMNVPMWFDGKSINEALFCEDFLRTRQIIFANGAFSHLMVE